MADDLTRIAEDSTRGARDEQITRTTKCYSIRTHNGSSSKRPESTTWHKRFLRLRIGKQELDRDISGFTRRLIKIKHKPKTK